jgi:DNA-binding Xre family transcriptional regulator
MVQLNLQRIFKARGIDQPYKFLVRSGFVPFTAHKYKNGKVEHIRLDHIEKLCVALNCTPNDIFEWTPDDLLDDRDNHPLQKIRTRQKQASLNQLLSTMPLEKLEEIEKMLAANAQPVGTTKPAGELF